MPRSPVLTGRCPEGGKAGAPWAPEIIDDGKLIYIKVHDYTNYIQPSIVYMHVSLETLVTA